MFFAGLKNHTCFAPKSHVFFLKTHVFFQKTHVIFLKTSVFFGRLKGVLLKVRKSICYKTIQQSQNYYLLKQSGSRKNLVRNLLACL
jgi:hypothetical protein